VNFHRRAELLLEVSRQVMAARPLVAEMLTREMGKPYKESFDEVAWFTYIAFLNPLSYNSIAPYPYLTASLPSATAAALAYFLGSLLVIRAGLGGYPRK
jgi:hypothetical protein